MPALADFKLQAYLLANAKEIIDLTKRTKLRRSHEAPISPYCRKAVPAPTEQPLDNNSFIANAFTEKDKIEFISALPGQIRPKIQPYYKIYKTFIEKDTKIEADVKLLDMAEVAAVNRKRAEDAGASGEIPEFLNPGVAVQNIEIVRLGGNPAEIDTNITVRIELYAQKLGHFFDRQKGLLPPFISGGHTEDQLSSRTRRQIEQGVAWVDLLKIDLDTLTAGDTGATSNREKQAAYFDIDTVLNLFEEYRNGNYYDDLEQRIKLEIGYNPVDDALLSTFPSDKQEQIKNMIASQKQTFYLNLVQNEISYNEKEGTNISVSFVAASGLSTNTRASDLLFDPYLYEEELRLNDLRSRIQAELKENGKGIDEFIVDPFSVLDKDADIDPLQLASDRGLIRPAEIQRGQRIPHAEFSKYTEEGRIAPLQTHEEKKAALDRIQTTLNHLRSIQRNLLINGLYGSTILLQNGDPDDSPDERAEQILGLPEIQGISAKKFKKSRVYLHFARYDDILNKVSKRLTTENEDGTGSPLLFNFGDLIWGSPPLPGGDPLNIKTGDLLDLSQDPGRVRTDEEVLETINSGNRNELTGDEIDVEFTFLGDIIDVALEIIASNNRAGQGRVSTEDRMFKKSKDLLYIGNSIDIVAKNALIKPFYFLPQSQTVSKRLRDLYKIVGEIIYSEIVYQNPADTTDFIKINLADLPISMVEYKKWFAANIGGTRRSNFFIGDFIRRLLRWASGLVADGINYDKSRTSAVEPPELTMNQFFVNHQDPHFLQSLTLAGNGQGGRGGYDASPGAINVSEIFRIVNNQDKTKPNPKSATLLSQTPQLVITSPTRTTRKIKDLEKNIPHVEINNSNAGSVQRVAFAREDMPGLRESRLFEGENFSRQSLLREKYNVTLELHGNTFFKPGSVFYLEPGQLDLGYTDDPSSYAQQLGLGGYFDTIRVEHQLYFGEKLEWVSIISSKWKSFGNNMNVKIDYDRKGVTSFLSRKAHAFDSSQQRGRNTLDNLFVEYYKKIASELNRIEREEGTD